MLLGLLNSCIENYSFYNHIVKLHFGFGVVFLESRQKWSAEGLFLWLFSTFYGYVRANWHEFLFCPNKVEWIETKGLLHSPLNNIKWLNSICLILVCQPLRSKTLNFSCRFFFVHSSHPSSLKQFFILSAEEKS